MLAGFEKV